MTVRSKVYISSAIVFWKHCCSAKSVSDNIKSCNGFHSEKELEHIEPSGLNLKFILTCSDNERKHCPLEGTSKSSNCVEMSYTSNFKHILQIIIRTTVSMFAHALDEWTKMGVCLQVECRTKE